MTGGVNRESADLLAPRILIVDDERQIHASLRLRLGHEYELAFCFNGREALERIARDRFDLCIVDIHMPDLDGLAFIVEAQKVDADLGFVVLSAFDTDENLRRAIPLQVYDFLGKPLPGRDGFERRVPDWIEQTRRQRRQASLAHRAGEMANDLRSAQLEREVELVASESARDALLQTAGLLTTIHAHLLSTTAYIIGRAKADPSLAHLLRGLEEARKTADAAVLVTESFFDSAYGNRDTSPAVVSAGMRHAISIASRMSGADTSGKTVDLACPADEPIIRGLTGIDFLLMMVPVVGVALTLAANGTTTRIRGEHVARLDATAKDPRFRSLLWINRRNALTSPPGIVISVSAPAKPFSRTEAEGWLNGAATPLPAITARGLVLGLKKAKGLLGLALAPESDEFQLVLALPT